MPFIDDILRPVLEWVGLGDLVAVETAPAAGGATIASSHYEDHDGRFSMMTGSRPRLGHPALSHLPMITGGDDAGGGGGSTGGPYRAPHPSGDVRIFESPMDEILDGLPAGEIPGVDWEFFRAGNREETIDFVLERVTGSGFRFGDVVRLYALDRDPEGPAARLIVEIQRYFERNPNWENARPSELRSLLTYQGGREGLQIEFLGRDIVASRGFLELTASVGDRWGRARGEWLRESRLAAYQELHRRVRDLFPESLRGERYAALHERLERALSILLERHGLHHGGDISDAFLDTVREQLQGAVADFDAEPRRELSERLEERPDLLREALEGVRHAEGIARRMR